MAILNLHPPYLRYVLCNVQRLEKNLDYILDWYAPEMIAQLTYGKSVRLDEVEESFSNISTLIDNTEHPLMHVLLDLSNVEEHPLSLGDLSNAAGNTLYKRGMGWLLTYGAEKKSVQYVMGMLATIADARFRHFSTEEDALLFLKQMDRNIPEDALGV